MNKRSGDNHVNGLDSSHIDRLIKASRDAESDDFVRPSDDTIFAYLSGKATDGQKSEMQRAQLKSAAFRSEMIDLAKSLEHLSEKDAIRTFETIRVPESEITALTDKISREAKGAAGEWEGTAPVQPGLTVFQRIMDYIRKATSSPRVIGLTGSAAAVIVVVLIYRAVTPGTVGPDVPLAQLSFQETYKTSDLTPPAVRGFGDLDVFLGMQETALMGFTRQLTFEGGRFLFDPVGPEATPSDDVRAVTFYITDSNDTQKHKITANVPSAARNVFAWILFTPSIELYNAPMIGNSVKVVRKPLEPGSESYLVFTYEFDGRYHTTQVTKIGG
jgi:hypothetical protein